MNAILKFDFKKKKITFFWSRLSNLHKKDPIFNVATTFSLKQGETRTSHGPIPHPLNQRISANTDKARIIQTSNSWYTSEPLKIEKNKYFTGYILIMLQ